MDDAGRIEVGARADLVTLDTVGVRTAGTGADEGTAVFAASGADVVRVLRDGVDVTVDRGDVGAEPGPGDRIAVGGPMTTVALTGIGELSTQDPELGVLHDAALVVEGGRVAWVGPAREAPAADTSYDLGGRAVVPGFVDSHAHLVFAGDRSQEFAARMTGTPYSAGGIRTTVAATRAATDEQLAANLARLVDEMRRQGTTTVEVKSGYGLTVHDEARSLAIARQVTEETTFLGAHVVAPEYADDPAAYVDLVTGPMLEACAPHARWIDVFCESGAFDEDQARAILQAGKAKGLGGRLHANQLGPGPGVRLACELGLAAVDHCTYLTDADVDALAVVRDDRHAAAGRGVLDPVALPRRPSAARRRRLVAIASDCNPGSCYTSSMPFCIALAVREMGMSPAEALAAATRGGARALGRTDVGHLGVGASADLAVLDAPSYLHLAYRPGVPLVRQTFVRGRTA